MILEIMNHPCGSDTIFKVKINVNRKKGMEEIRAHISQSKAVFV